MHKTTSTYRMMTLGVLALAMAGCASSNPPLARTPVPDSPTVQTGRTAEKPLPAPRRDELIPPPPFDDPPLISQAAPETPAFIAAYKAVNNPRISVFVNRTLEGATIPVNPDQPVASVEHTRKSSGGVTVDRNTVEQRGDAWRGSTKERNDRFSTTGPAEYRESTAVYLRPGEYDEIAAKALDYEAIENVLAEFLRSDGRVQIMSPLTVRQKLTDEQVKALESGRPTVLREIAEQLDTDILIHVTARPTRQTQAGLEVRILCEAVNIRGGESIASAVVDVPPPLVKTTINRYTRYLGRRLIDGMTKTWQYGPPPAANQPESARPAPATPDIAPAPGSVPQTDAPRPLPPPDRAPPPASSLTPPPTTMPER